MGFNATHCPAQKALLEKACIKKTNHYVCQRSNRNSSITDDTVIVGSPPKQFTAFRVPISFDCMAS